MVLAAWVIQNDVSWSAELAEFMAIKEGLTIAWRLEHY